MAWIRLDCSMLDDEFTYSLTGDEFKAWTLFLLRVKAYGGRGKVGMASVETLSRTWNVPKSAIGSMLTKAGNRIKEANNTWFVTNWSKYQEDHKSAKGEFPEDALLTPSRATLQYTTPQYTTEQKDKKARASNPESAKDVENYLTEYQPTISKSYITVEAAKFFDHFTANGWKVGGKSPMKDWRAAARNWLRQAEVYGKGAAPVNRQAIPQTVNRIQMIACPDCETAHKATEVCPKCHGVNA
jgi:hypothetical protein